MKVIINLKVVLMILGLTAFFHQTRAQEKDFDESVLSAEGKKAYQTLLKIKLFAIGGIGPGGKTSEGEDALDILFEEKEASSAFKGLIVDATAEGSLYGVLGLKMLGNDYYEKGLTEYISSKVLNNSEKFSMQSGCTSYIATENSDKKFVIDYIFKNFSELAARKQKLREHRQVVKKQGSK